MERDQAIRFVHDLLRLLLTKKGSDLFLTAEFPPAFKVDGRVLPVSNQPLTAQHTAELVRSIMNDRQAAEFESAKECNFAINPTGIGRFRVSAFVQQGKVGIVFRVIADRIPTVEELNLPPLISELSMAKRGIVLVVGATGSGKSTTMAAMVGYRNENSQGHIITIEDPIEFLHRDQLCHINQREVGTDTGSFAAALRRVLRQDPDIIMIGEIRDLETLDTALKAADTGHLVLSTLHTTDATQTINRVMSFYPPHQQSEVRFALSSALSAIVSLRLVPRVDRPGRVPAAEVLINTAAVRDQIRDQQAQLNIPDLIREGTVQYGMQTFDQSLMQWYTKGAISYESAMFYATNPSEFALRAQGVGATSDQTWDPFQQG